MEFANAVERLSKEKEIKLRTVLAGLQRGGPQVAARREVELEFAEKMCVALAEIWTKLLEETNGGVFTREQVDFIKEQVHSVAAARRSSLMKGPPMAPNWQAIARSRCQRDEKITARVYRDLELRLLRRKAGLSRGAS